LARLIRYTARGAVSLERLEQDAYGDLIYTFTKPWSDGTTGITLSPVELLEKLAALVPLPRVPLVRYGGCLAPQSKVRGVIIPMPRPQGLEEPEAGTPSPPWSWARLLTRVFGIARARCPVCQQGTLRLIAAMTEGSVIRKILRHLQRAVAPPPMAPARQAAFAWDISSP
jgi:Putative transposase